MLPLEREICRAITRPKRWQHRMPGETLTRLRSEAPPGNTLSRIAEPKQDTAYRLDSSCTIASTMLSMVSVTRLLGRLKLFERMEKARCSPLMVVA